MRQAVLSGQSASPSGRFGATPVIPRESEAPGRRGGAVRAEAPACPSRTTAHECHPSTLPRSPQELESFTPRPSHRRVETRELLPQPRRVDGDEVEQLAAQQGADRLPSCAAASSSATTSSRWMRTERSVNRSSSGITAATSAPSASSTPGREARLPRTAGALAEGTSPD
jgi:hypothetical protein